MNVVIIGASDRWNLFMNRSITCYFDSFEELDVLIEEAKERINY